MLLWILLAALLRTDLAWGDFRIRNTRVWLTPGENLTISLTSHDLRRMVFKPWASTGSPKVVMEDLKLVDPRWKMNSRKDQLTLPNVTLQDQGLYEMMFQYVNVAMTTIHLTVMECVTNISVYYGEDFEFALTTTPSSVRVEFEPLAPGPQVPRLLLNYSHFPNPQYDRRATVHERQLTLRKMSPEDQGKYTIWDSIGHVLKTVCLKVVARKEQKEVSYGATVEIPFYARDTEVELRFSPESEHPARLLVDGGVIVDEQYAQRLRVGTHECTLANVTPRDRGTYEVRDKKKVLVLRLDLQVGSYVVPPYFIALKAFGSMAVVVLCVCAVPYFRKTCRELDSSGAPQPRVVEVQPGRTAYANAYSNVPQDIHPPPPYEAKPKEWTARKQERKAYIPVHEGTAASATETHFGYGATEVALPSEEGNRFELIQSQPQASAVSVGDTVFPLPVQMDCLAAGDPRAPEFQISGLRLDSGPDPCTIYTSDKLNLGPSHS
ncbi:uncharacterized protein LOC136771343 isoform X2 [Amia ocellicauda]|uniref:uncharacterized protein LOC136771343 isoform X2 n=1 Tax=Amia ocellicauda TaxID=2972642 RepID=UPI003464A63D